MPLYLVRTIVPKLRSSAKNTLLEEKYTNLPLNHLPVAALVGADAQQAAFGFQVG